MQDRLYRYMDDANLSISEMEPYFAYYPDKLYKNLVETRVIYKDMEEEILLEKKRGMAYVTNGVERDIWYVFFSGVIIEMKTISAQTIKSNLI